MDLSIGIVGLPNVGKSTLFNALMKRQAAQASNYPFCTITPNKGIVEVPDKRLEVLAKIVNAKKITPAAVEFVDIAGLVKGASQGEGLGNKFLANIREVSAICHIVRAFEDEDIAHVEKNISPLSDAELINSELIIADLQTLERQKEPKGKATPQEKEFFELVGVLQENLSKGILASQVKMSAKEQIIVKELCLLTSKPIMYALNISEEQLEKKDEILKDFLLEPKIAFSAKMEDEVNVLTESEREEYLMQFGLAEPGLERLIRLAYKILGLISFFSAEPKEVHAWTIKEGTCAREAAGVIHTDFYKHFIKAAAVSFEVFSSIGGWANAKNAGKIRFEGADYIVREADVIDFKIGC